jgi:hypothetical protein
VSNRTDFGSFEKIETFPLFRSMTCFYLDRPIAIMSAAEGLEPSGRIVRLDKAQMRQVGETLGFRELDRALLPKVLVSGHLVICGPTGVTLEVEGNSLKVEQLSAPSDAWLSAVRGLGYVHVLFCVPTRPDDLDVRKLLGNGRAFGGLAEVVVIDTHRWEERFTFLGAQGSTRPVPVANTVVLDSSVLIDLEQVARGSRNESYSGMVQQLVLQLKALDVLPGSAMAELTAGRDDATRSTGRVQSLHATMNAWFDGGSARARSLADVQSAYRDELARLRRVPLPGPAGHPFQRAFYASMLKLACSWLDARDNFRGAQRVHLYDEYAQWMAHQLGVVLAYSMKVARDRLVGPQKDAAYTENLLKLGRPSLQNIWGASWDMFHLSTIDLIQYGEVLDVGGRAVLLATADKALVSLRNRIHDFDGHESGRSVKIARGEVDRRLRDHEQRIRAVDEELHSTVLNRLPDISLFEERVVNEVRRLEQDFSQRLGDTAPV